MKETKIFNNNEVLTNLAKETVEKRDKILIDKDKTISELKEKITDLERQNNDLDYLLNSGRNKFEHERNKRLKELETKLNQQTKLITEIKLYRTQQELNDLLKEQKEPVILYDEFEKKDNSSKLTKISGILTSQIRSKASSDTPYMAFFRIEDCIDCHNTKELCQVLRPRHKNCEECANSKCKDCEIPVIFRIWTGQPYEICFDVCCRDNKEYWQKPDLKKGDSVILEGKFASSDHSPRPSFTAYSYEIIQ